MRIDVHAHYWSADYLDLLAGFGRMDTDRARRRRRCGTELEARLTLMDRAGIR